MKDFLKENMISIVLFLYLMGGDDRMGGSDPVHYQPTPEEINMVLNNFRVGASQKEKQIIDYLMDREGDSHEEQNSTAKMD